MAEELGSPQPEKQHTGKFPGFSCPVYPGLGTGATGNPEMPMGTDKRSLNKIQLFLGKGTGMRQPNKTENLQTFTVPGQPETTALSAPGQQRSSGKPRFPHSLGCKEVPPRSHMGGFRKCLAWAWGFRFCHLTITRPLTP